MLGFSVILLANVAFVRLKAAKKPPKEHDEEKAAHTQGVAGTPRPAAFPLLAPLSPPTAVI